MGSGATSNPAALVTGADTVPSAPSRQQLSPPGVRTVAGASEGLSWLPCSRLAPLLLQPLGFTPRCCHR